MRRSRCRAAARLGADPHRHAARHERDDQHHEERQQMLGVRHREGEVRRHEEEIEGEDAQDRRATVGPRDDRVATPTTRGGTP
jgi:hypothetical protein